MRIYLMTGHCGGAALRASGSQPIAFGSQCSGQALDSVCRASGQQLLQGADGERHGQPPASFVFKHGCQDLYVCELWPGGNE